MRTYIGVVGASSSVESTERPSAVSSSSSRSFRASNSLHHSNHRPLRLRGGIDIVTDDDDVSSEDQPPPRRAGEEDDDSENEEDDHDGDYEDDDEEESPSESAVDDDDGLEYADDPEAVHAHQQEQQLRYQQQGWTSGQHRQYQQEQYQRQHQQYWEEHQHQYRQPEPPRVITLEDYEPEDGEDDVNLHVHTVIDTSYKRARQQQRASTSRRQNTAPRRQVVVPRYPHNQFGSRPYDPNAPPQVAFTDDELLGDLPEEEVLSDYPRFADKGKGKAQVDDSEEDERETAEDDSAAQDEAEDPEAALYALIESKRKPSSDDENMPHDDEPKDPYPLGSADGWHSDDAVQKWANDVARRDNPGAPKPIYSEMGEQRFKDEMERKRQEEIKAREPAPYKQDGRTIRQVGFDPVAVPPGASPAVTPVIPPQMFGHGSQRRRGPADPPYIQTGFQVVPPSVGGSSISSLPSPAQPPSALSMSLSRSMRGQQTVYAGYSPGTGQQQLPPSLPQPLVAHQHRRQQQLLQQRRGSQQTEPEIWSHGALGVQAIPMPAMRQARGRSRSLDSSRSPSLALRQAASSAEYRAVKLRDELKKSLQKQNEKTRLQEAERKLRMREERGVQTGARADGVVSVRSPRTREERRAQRGRSGQPREEHPSPTTSITALPPSTHRPLPDSSRYRSRRIGTADLAALRPAALNPAARPSIGLDDRQVQSTATSAATSTTSLLLGGSGSEIAALENWTPLERPPAEGVPRRSANTSSNASPQPSSPALGYSSAGSGNRSGGSGRFPMFAGGLAGPYGAEAAAAAFQSSNPLFYTRPWGVFVRPNQSTSEEDVVQSGSGLPGLPEVSTHQQSSAPHAHAAASRPPLASNRTQPSHHRGRVEANGATGRRRSATNPTPTAAQLLLQQSGYGQMTGGDVYGREREWKRSDEEDDDEDVLPSQSQGFRRGTERNRGRGGAAGGSAVAPDHRHQPSRALQRQQEGQSSFRNPDHDQSFRTSPRHVQARDRPSTSNNHRTVANDGGSAEGNDVNVDARYNVQHAASMAAGRGGARGGRREQGARGSRTTGATMVTDAKPEPTTVFEPQSARSGRFAGSPAFNDADSPPTPSYLDASPAGASGRSPYGRRPHTRNGDIPVVDPHSDSRAPPTTANIRPTQPPTGTPSRGFPLIVAPVPRRNRLPDAASSHNSQRFAYSFTGGQTPSTSLLAASHFLGVNPAQLAGGNRSEYGEDYDAHDLFSQDGGSVHSVPSDSVARGRPALRANA